MRRSGSDSRLLEPHDPTEMALRFILAHPAVSTVIPGMRRLWHVEHNLAASDGQPLSPRLREALRHHRWDRGTLISFSA
jgi:aryl-alcohol dehydrogenase-like predicted oxidoreductase